MTTMETIYYNIPYAINKTIQIAYIIIHLYTNPHLLLLNVPQILKPRGRVKFWENSGWPIWFLNDPLSKTNLK